MTTAGIDRCLARGCGGQLVGVDFGDFSDGDIVECRACGRLSSVDGWMRFSVLREAAGAKWAQSLSDAEAALRRGVFVPMHNPRGPVETCLATSAYNLVELWHEGYRPETGAKKPRRVR